MRPATLVERWEQVERVRFSLSLAVIVGTAATAPAALLSLLQDEGAPFAEFYNILVQTAPLTITIFIMLGLVVETKALQALLFTPIVYFITAGVVEWIVTNVLGVTAPAIWDQVGVVYQIDTANGSPVSVGTLLDAIFAVYTPGEVIASAVPVVGLVWLWNQPDKPRAQEEAKAAPTAN